MKTERKIRKSVIVWLAILLVMLGFESYAQSNLVISGGVATVTATNTGSVATEDVVQLYMKDNKSTHAVRNHRLCGFQRVNLAAGESTTVDIAIDKTAFDVVDDEGNRFIDSDHFTLYAGVCQPDELSQQLSNTECVSVEINL